MTQNDTDRAGSERVGAVAVRALRRRGRSLALPLAALLAAPAVGASAAGGGVADLVARHGIRPVAPPAAAREFDLPHLAGGRGALSDFSGRWVVLTFWATWCGPCRVEMPSLEALHRSRGGQGLAVVGLSIDAEPGPARAFANELGLSFPMFWDERGEMAAAYRAASIPLSYLIDPAGRIVGVSRGARDWSALAPLVDGLLAAVPAGADSEREPAYASEGAVELTSVLHPPSAEVELVDPSPEVGKAFRVDVRLRWAGDFAEYLPQPPKLFLPEGVAEERMTAATSSRDGRNLVTYQLRLVAAEPGRFALDPVELRYLPRYESQPLTRRVAGPTVEVGPRTVAGLRPRTLALGAGAGGVAVLGLLAAGRWRRRRRPQADGAAPYDAARRRLDEARRLRLAGDARAALLTLLELEAEVAGGEPPSGHAELLEAARYGGRVPSAAELDRLQRRIERRVESLRPDPESRRRSELRFKKADPELPGRGSASPDTEGVR